MLTRSWVTAILLLAAVAAVSCERDVVPTQPTESQSPPELASDIVGEYQLTFTASPSCSLPTQLMKRTYKANLKAWVNFAPVAVDVSGAKFFHDWAAGFDGTRNGDTMQFEIVGMNLNFPPYGYSLAELIDGNTWLAYDGAARATIRGNTISGAFDGKVVLREVLSDDAYGTVLGAVLAECRATDHKIEFVR
jgi:hypothetical protein